MIVVHEGKGCSLRKVSKKEGLIDEETRIGHRLNM